MPASLAVVAGSEHPSTEAGADIGSATDKRAGGHRDDSTAIGDQEQKSEADAKALTAAEADAVADAAIDQVLDDLASAPYAPVMTEPGQRAYLFSIPAPRGLILDRHGLPLARNRTALCLALRLSQIDATDEEGVVELVDAALDANPFLSNVLIRPSAARVRAHWQHRRGLPLVITAPLDEDLAKELEHSIGPAFSLESIYLRDYPQASVACHVVGHVSREDPELYGPVVRGESLWPQVQGRSGMEKMYDELLSGSPGLVSELYADDGTLLSRKLLKAPRPGLTFVLSIDIGMQRLAVSILSEKNRPGAMVTVDADTGELLAVASWPQFNPADFVPSMSEEKYRQLTEDADNPFFPRAIQGVYPPGSTFKPFVALAALDGQIINKWTEVSAPPSLEVAGRTFRNWTDKHQGMLNVSEALARSSNTWFYQVGIQTGSDDIVDSVAKFGFGRSPDIPLDGTASGFLPAVTKGDQAVANLSIGQGDLLVSPLQMALASAGLAGGGSIPRARLVLQTQTAPPDERLVAVQAGPPSEAMPFREQDLDAVRYGMWSAVNTKSGTAGAARMSWPEVSGKTGTAQWASGKQTRNVAWFIGYVNADKPRLAFAVAIEGETGVSTAGGKNAAPLAGEFLQTVYGNPELYAVTVPPRTMQRTAANTSIASADPPGSSRGSSSSSRQPARMIQISPDRSRLSGSATPPAPSSSSSSSSRQSSSIMSRSSRDTPPTPQPSQPKRGGFLSRLRGLFPSSN